MPKPSVPLVVPKGGALWGEGVGGGGREEARVKYLA